MKKISWAIITAIATVMLVAVPAKSLFVDPWSALPDTASNTDVFNAISAGIFYFFLLLLIAVYVYFFTAYYKPLKVEHKALKESDAKDKQDLEKDKQDLEKDNAKCEKEIKKLTERLKKVPQNIDFLRFEGIKSSCLKYGFINYSPYFHVDKDQLTGIGFKVLKSIFRVFDTDEKESELEHVQVSSWSKIMPDLREGKYDVIATPLYETRTRLYHESNVSFCLPLFYAEIGLYMVQKCNNEKSLLEAKKSKANWRFAFIKDEVSETMMYKFSDETNGHQICGQNDIGYLDLLKSVIDNNNPANIVAMEVFKADKFINDNELSSLSNILKAKQILYPVSFAVRKEDTTLRNFINLRIIELLSGGNENELQKIIEEEATRLGFDANSIFIHKYEWNDL